jgi:CubicO group peptidase (beta-lactamase class C family)
MSYDRYVRERIFLPAGMTLDRQPAGERAGARPGRAVSSDPGGSLRSAADTLPWRGTSAGGGYSTVGDLQKFAAALLAHRLLDAQHTTLLLTARWPRRARACATRMVSKTPSCPMVCTASGTAAAPRA